MADCLSRWPIPPARACRISLPMAMRLRPLKPRRIIEMERLMEEEGAKCFVVMAAKCPPPLRG